MNYYYKKVLKRYRMVRCQVLVIGGDIGHSVLGVYLKHFVLGPEPGIFFLSSKTFLRIILSVIFKFFLTNNIELKCSFIRCQKYHKS